VSNDHIRPSSIEGIKQLAKRFKKSDGIQHAVAMDKASKGGWLRKLQACASRAWRRLRRSPAISCALHFRSLAGSYDQGDGLRSFENAAPASLSTRC
jgi:hypothetical protein